MQELAEIEKVVPCDVEVSTTQPLVCNLKYDKYPGRVVHRPLQRRGYSFFLAFTAFLGLTAPVSGSTNRRCVG